MIDLLPSETISHIFYPWTEFKLELDNLFFQQRRIIRSSIRLCSITLATCIGIYLLLYNPEIRDFFLGLIKSLKFIPVEIENKAAILLGIISFSSLGAYASKASIRAFCKCCFGDPDFFLTKKRTQELLLLFKEKKSNIEEHTLKEVVRFCVTNLRNPQPTPDIGTSAKDWEKILISILDYGDLSCFFAQQVALTAQLNHIAALKEEIDRELEKELTKHNALHIAPPLFSETTPLLLSSSARRSSRLSKESSSSFEEASIDQTTITQELSLLGQQILAHFEHQHRKRHSSPLPHGFLLDRCCSHLRTREHYTKDRILPDSILSSLLNGSDNQQLSSTPNYPSTSFSEELLEENTNVPALNVQQPTPINSIIRDIPPAIPKPTRKRAATYTTPTNKLA